MPAAPTRQHALRHRRPVHAPQRRDGGHLHVAAGGSLGTSASNGLIYLASGSGGSALDHRALGPNLGQCCGGAVTLLTEVYTTAPPETDVIARATDGSAMPLAVKRLLTSARNQGHLPASQLLQGSFIQP